MRPVLVRAFFGVYNPDPDDVVDLLNPVGIEPGTGARRRRRDVSTYISPEDRLALNTHSMSDPLSCLELGATMLWSITDTSYPRYDKHNLWNSNPTFDHGKFDELDSNQRLSDSSLTLFAFRFTEPGTYAFRMDNATQKRLVKDVAVPCSFWFCCIRLICFAVCTRYGRRCAVSGRRPLPTTDSTFCRIVRHKKGKQSTHRTGLDPDLLNGWRRITTHSNSLYCLGKPVIEGTLYSLSIVPWFV